MKYCIKCNVLLNSDNTTWYRMKNYIYKCNDCVRKEKAEQARKKQKQNPQKYAERSRKYLNKLKTEFPKKYTARQQYSSAQKRAQALNLNFNLTCAFIESISPDYCPILNKPLKYGGGEKTNESPALDRINPEKGYIRGNVQIVSLLANLMKSNATEKDMLAFAEWVFKNYKNDKKQGTQTDSIRRPK